VAGCSTKLGGAPVRYRFSHALVQQTLLDEIPTVRTLALPSRDLPRQSNACAADHLDRYRAALARHWYEAGTEPGRALDASVAAASGHWRSTPIGKRSNGSCKPRICSTMPGRQTSRGSM